MTERSEGDLSYRHIFDQWLPLALSWVMMSIASPIVSAGISRLPNAAVNLAAYGVTMDIAVLVESPIIMVLSASVALIHGRASYALVRRFVTHLSIILTALGVLVYFTPLYNPLFMGVIKVPPEVAEAAHPALRLMLFWPMAIGWRRLYQGILIARGRARLVTFGTVWRLAALVGMTVLGVALGWPGAVVGGAALAMSVIVEALVIIWWARPFAREVGAVEDEGHQPASVMSYRQFILFYLPLAATDVMRVVSRPVTVAGIARASMATLSLAAWPPGLGLSSLMSSGVMALQEIVVAQFRAASGQRRLGLFALAVGVAFTGLQALLTLTPLADWYFRQAIGLPREVEALALPTAQILLPLPLLLAARNFGRGVLIARRQSGHVQGAMAANLVALSVFLTLGVWQGGLTGALLAAWGTVAAHCLEVTILMVLARPPLPQASRTVSLGASARDEQSLSG
ncbi:MAG: hypothetical protein KIT87_08175 [Anaerolineae bacterium]|nr:hypothetical protein [Anaerolineae bacterium]